jgi:hypothetical protein
MIFEGDAPIVECARPPLTPELRFWMRFVEDAVECVRGGLAAHPRVVSDAVLWFRSDEHDVCSFLHVCDILGLDAMCVRQTLRCYLGDERIRRSTRGRRSAAYPPPRDILESILAESGTVSDIAKRFVVTKAVASAWTQDIDSGFRQRVRQRQARIQELRAEGWKVRDIARELQVAVNTVVRASRRIRAASAA